VTVAVELLPHRQRTALVLHRDQGLSHQQVAEVTGWSTSAAESLLVRACAGCAMNWRICAVPEHYTAGSPPRSRFT
jgi:DNA-directed RNA polymerase specialized sigma24 family protein